MERTETEHMARFAENDVDKERPALENHTTQLWQTAGL
jgi:hypothetical protein